jgi:hypothetical protein
MGWIGPLGDHLAHAQAANLGKAGNPTKPCTNALHPRADKNAQRMNGRNS